MGDRANVVIKGKDNEGGDLVLYTHWGGSRVESIVQDGLRAAERAGRLQGDQSYAQRSIVQVFLTENGDPTSLGAGIYVGKPYEPHVVVIDYDASTVTFDPAGNEYGPEGGTVTESFEDFLSRSFVGADA
jgi:hypothetical protein